MTSPKLPKHTQKYEFDAAELSPPDGKYKVSWCQSKEDRKRSRERTRKEGRFRRRGMSDNALRREDQRMHPVKISCTAAHVIMTQRIICLYPCAYCRFRVDANASGVLLIPGADKLGRISVTLTRDREVNIKTSSCARNKKIGGL